MNWVKFYTLWPVFYYTYILKHYKTSSNPCPQQWKSFDNIKKLHLI